jgi:uncharacterized protein YjdB
MKTRKWGFAVFSAIVVFGFLFTGCKTGDESPKKVAVKSVTLDPVEFELTVGEKATLIATILPKNASNKTVTWISSDESKATVTKDGVVEAVGVGSLSITVATKNGKKAYCEIIVHRAPVDRIAVTGVALNKNVLELEEGHSALLEATISPLDAGNKGVTWLSSDPKKVTVADGSDPDVPAGTVKAVAETTEPVIIKVTTKDGNKTDFCEVTVVPRPPEETPVTGVTLDPVKLELENGATVLLRATVSPAEATDKTVRWTVNPAGFVTVAGTGLTVTVTAVGVGEATVTVTTEDNSFTAHCEVTVKPVAVIRMTLDKTTIYLERGGTETLTPLFTPANATNKNVTWVSSNTERVSVVDGVLTAGTTAGTTGYTITATSQDGNKVATCTVYVVIPVTGVTLNVTREDNLATGTYITLTATIAPSEATIRNLTWKSSNESVVRVSSVQGYANRCNVIGVSEGTATVTVTTEDGGKTATCDVNVIYQPFDGVALNTATLTVSIGGTPTNLTATLTPEDAGFDTIAWSTSDSSIVTVAPAGTGRPGNLTGRVTGVSPGFAVITVTLDDNPAKSDICVVTVVSQYVVTSVTLNRSLLIMARTNTATLIPTVLPATASDKTVSWHTSNPNVATVTGGVVTAVGPGIATITVTTNDGNYPASCSVMVDTAPPVPDFVWINAGTFMMGSPADEKDRAADGYTNSENLHSVTLTKGFYMGETTVTQAQYEAVMGAAANKSDFPREENVNYHRKGEFPVDNVNWHEAILYCNTRSIQEGLSPVYSMYKENAPNANGLTVSSGRVTNWTDTPANWSTNPVDWGGVPYDNTFRSRRWTLARMVEGADGYRLPTEAEWEYACRAGTTTPWNTGTGISAAEANFGSITARFTVPVKSYPANAWDLYEMHGNVIEWCWDWAVPYASGSQTDPNPGFPTGTTLPAKRHRGGSYAFGATSMRSASRGQTEPWYSTPYPVTLSMVGFRVVRNAPNN